VTETLTLAVAGDTMLGRSVADRVRTGLRPEQFVAPELAELLRSADLALVNLECCISDRGTPWPAPGKPFFFRAPPIAVDVLRSHSSSASRGWRPKTSPPGSSGGWDEPAPT
jgi:poly-gamma-glutamate synthesis protein (capsule biosynthesis protein)